MTIYSKPATYGTIADGKLLQPDHLTDLYEHIYDTILDGGITSDQISDDAVTTAKIGTGQVTAAKIATDAVTTVKILDEAVTTAKLEENCLSADGAGRALMQDAFVTYAKVTNGIGRFAMGTYTGDGDPTQAIEDPGFQPTFLMIVGPNRNMLAIKMDAGDHASGYAWTLSNGIQPGIIDSFDTDGFTVSSTFSHAETSNVSYNEITRNYYYLCGAFTSVS